MPTEIEVRGPLTNNEFQKLLSFLKKEADFIRFAGQKAQLKLRMPIATRKNFVGIIGAVNEGVLQMDVDGVPVEIELANVDKARLVPTF